MKMGEKGKLELEKRKDTSTDYHSPNISSDWQFSGTNLANLPINLVPTGNPLAVVSSSSCSSAPLVDSFSQTIWDHSTNSQNLAYYDVDVQNNASSSSAFGFRKASSALLRSSIDRSLDLGWNPASSMLKGGIFLPNAPGLFRQSLSQSPADSAFIERAARFSSFSGGNFSDMMNTFGIPEPACLDSRVGGMTQGPQEVFAGSGGKSVSGGQSPKNGMHMAEVSKDASLLNQINVTTGGSTHKNEEKGESLAKSHEEAKKGFGRSGGDSDEAEFSGGGQDEPSAVEGTCGEPPVKVLSSKKRKRNGQDIELDQTKRGLLSGEAAKGNNDNQKKGDQNLSPSTSKPPGKQGKQGSQTADPPKGDYIHVRARRGQATNSHSLAERVRREKISERMKFLQDIVPGCSKVTGKAVMLDEIINYVQSLQRQVEFLSMKLATVNPRLDFNIEGLLAKDILQSRPGPSPTLGFSPDMPMAYPPLHQSQGILVHAALPGMGNPSDIRLRTANSHLTAVSGVFKEASQATNVWEDELHNVVQMSYGASALSDSQDVNGSIPPGQMKVEL